MPIMGKQQNEKSNKNVRFNDLMNEKFSEFVNVSSMYDHEIRRVKYTPFIAVYGANLFQQPEGSLAGMNERDMTEILKYI